MSDQFMIESLARGICNASYKKATYGMRSRPCRTNIEQKKNRPAVRVV